MSYVVSWWVGERQDHHVYETQEEARRAQAALVAQSAKRVATSLVPVRVISNAVWKTMSKLKKDNDAGSCTHGLRRLCLVCLSRLEPVR